MIDLAKVKINAGKGGGGIAHFLHLKFMPKGGPDGGDGGKGGDVYLFANENLTTLMDFRAKAVFNAPDGGAGEKNNKHGANGEDLVLEVPSGTLVKLVTKDGGERVIADLTKHGEKFLLARGGAGGKGNSHFKSSTNRTPREFTRGDPGEEVTIILEIKLIADVGFIGFPNAGKSTLLNILTKANARVGSYPFTTLEPNLGVMDVPSRKKSLVLADLPGLIEGAALGRGLGDEFLKHAERTRLLVHVIDPYQSGDVLAIYTTIRHELSSYSEALEKKKEIIVINKIDITEVKDSVAKIKGVFKKKGLEVMFVSAVTGEGIEKLKEKIAEEVSKLPSKPQTKVTAKKVYTISNLPNRRIVFRGRPEVAPL